MSYQQPNACPSLRSAGYSAHPSAPSGGTSGQQYLLSLLGTYCAEAGHAFRGPGSWRMSGCKPETWGSVQFRPSSGTAGLQVLLRQQHMRPLCPRWSSMQTANGAPRPPAHPSLRHSRDTPEESYLGCRRCPPVPGTLRLRFHLSPSPAPDRRPLEHRRHLVAVGQ